MADAIPVRVGHYELVRTIGKGNFAVVKLGRHSLTNQKVAVKVIGTRQLDSEQMKKLWREIDIMKRVQQHEQIVRLYQVMQSPNHVMLVTEFCAGGEIFDQLVQNGRMSEPIARNYFRQILTAVEFLHSKGIVHRDLKAENLLLSADLSRVKLADFGFSNFFAEKQLLNTWCGSPPYAAPELFEGKQYFGPKADIWSLGVVLYVLVCGALPFDGHTLQALKTRVLCGKFRIPFFMSSECEHLIRHLLLVDPEKRLSIQQIKAHKWLQSPAPEPPLTPSEDSESEDTPTLDMSLVDWVSRELSVDCLQVVESLRNRHFDHNYALYHLIKDHTSSHSPNQSAPPSPPLLPLVPSTNQRKSSITTGVVERETTPTDTCGLSAATPSPLRRHTFGPDGGQSSSSQTQLVTPPLLFLTPPSAPPPFPASNLRQAPPNYPIGYPMDLLRPPNVLLMVNNNMGRRASDGQANYACHVSTCSQSQSEEHVQSSCQSLARESSQKAKEKRKRHSLTTSEDIGRQRRSGVTGIQSPNQDRSRRRASDGSSQTSRHVISISSLQTELRALCVSSPPSLHSSPQHVTQHVVSTCVPLNSQTSPSSPPPIVLPQINETEDHAPTQPPLLTPPHSFRSSPTPLQSPQSPIPPGIALTDSEGIHFPILPPPESFTAVVSTCDLHVANQEPEEDMTSLSRWRNEESRRQQFVAHAQLRQTFPPSLPAEHSSGMHFRSLQTLLQSDDRKLWTTGSGSICVRDVSAAARLLQRFRDQRIGFVDTDLQISLEWSELRQQLVLRRVSGDQSEYKSLCRHLIHSVM